MINDRKIARIDGFAIDCIVSESHERESDVTSLPVEDGSNITDNIRPKNRTCSIEGIVSDTPAGDLSSERDVTQDDSVVTTQAACDTLESAWAQSRTVVVETPFMTYPRMAIKSLTMPRDAKTGRALKFSVKFEEIRIRQTIRVSVAAIVRSVDSRASAKKPMGKKAGKNVNNKRYQVHKGDTAYVTNYGTFKEAAGDHPLSFREFTTQQEQRLFNQGVKAGLAGNQAGVDNATAQAVKLEEAYHSREGLSKANDFAEDHPYVSNLLFGSLGSSVVKTTFNDSL